MSNPNDTGNQDPQNTGTDAGAVNTGTDDEGALPQYTDEQLAAMSTDELVALNKQMFARTTKAESKYKELRDKPADKGNQNINNQGVQKNNADQGPDINQVATDVAGIKLNYEKQAFATANRLSPKQTEVAYQMFGGKQPTEDQLAQPYVQSALKTIAQQESVGSNTPVPTRNTPIYKGKSYSEVVTDPSSTKEDRNAALDALRKRRLGF